MRAINKYIIIEEMDDTPESDIGLLLTPKEMSEFRYKLGKVIAPGTEVDTVKGGEVVYYDKSAGHAILLEGKRYKIILERDVAIVV